MVNMLSRLMVPAGIGLALIVGMKAVPKMIRHAVHKNGWLK
ncbi:MAG: hypothetical protein ACYDH6_16055 [Acidimicrobiales bacterium]